MHRAIVIAACLLACLCLVKISSAVEQIQLTAVLPKLKALHEDAQTLLIKNIELKAMILVGLKAQNEAKLEKVKESKDQQVSEASTANQQQQKPSPPQPLIPQSTNSTNLIQKQDARNNSIDYSELEEFNRWVDVNLEYAVKNTQATEEALKEEALHNNGTVVYSEQAINDGVEGMKYWQAAVIFQDKTLKNEKFEVDKLMNQ